MTKNYFTEESHTKICFIFENCTPAVFQIPDQFLKIRAFWILGIKTNCIKPKKVKI